MAVHGILTDFRLDATVGGSLTDYSTYAKSVDYSRVADAIEVTTYQATGNGRVYAIGLKDHKFTVEFDYSTAMLTVLNTIFAPTASISYQYGPAGSVASNIKYTGECLPIDIKLPTKATAENVITVMFQGTGAVTVGTY